MISPVQNPGYHFNAKSPYVNFEDVSSQVHYAKMVGKQLYKIFEAKVNRNVTGLQRMVDDTRGGAAGVLR